MLEGKHFQNAYVTRDIDGWVEKFKSHAKIDKLLAYEGANEVVTPAGPVTQTSKLAFIWIDNLQIELIQPISGGVQIYSDALPEGDGLQFHHICARISDWDDFRARVDRQPYPVVLERNVPGDRLKFVYLDARPFLGHYLEYVWMDDERWKQIGGN